MAQEENNFTKNNAETGKPFLQYIPRYSYAQTDNNLAESPSSIPSIISPVSPFFGSDDSSFVTPSKSHLTEQLGNHSYRVDTSGSPLKSEFPESAQRLTGNTGSYKSGRKQRPRSVYGDLGSFIANGTPSLAVKRSRESLGNESVHSQSTAVPTLQSLAQSPEQYFQLSPPVNSYNSAGNRSSWYSTNSGNASKEYHSRNGSEIFYTSRSGSPVRNGGASSATGGNNSPSKRKDPNSLNPFNYSSVTMSNQNLPKPAHRRGHRYKHSSVSMNFFPEPKKRANLNIPSSLPIPTIYEFFESCTYPQKLKLVVCVFHLFYASVVFIAGFKYSLMCLTTLSHLVFFDAVNNTISVVVEIFKNFEVWDKTCIRYPFGLSRIELLFGFALSVSLFYVGFDLITHSLEEFVVSLIDRDLNHDNHHNHHNNDQHWELSDPLFLLLVFVGIALTLLCTKITSGYDEDFQDHDVDVKSYYNKSNLDIDDSKFASQTKWSRFKTKCMDWKFVTVFINKVLKNNTISKNPIKLLTLTFLCYLIVYPTISKMSIDLKLNEIQTFAMSIIILILGFKTIKKLSQTILLSFPYSTAVFKKSSNEIKEEIVKLDSFKSNFIVKKIIVSKVNYELFVVMSKIKMVGGSDVEELRLRNDISDVIKSVLQRNSSELRLVEYDITIDVDRM